MAIELDRDTYENVTLKSKEPVLVDFWGPQCRPCLALMPAVDKIEEEYAGKLKVAKVNVTTNRMLCAKLRVMSVPTYILYKDGAESKRIVGEQTTGDDIKNAVKAIVS